MKRKQYLRKIEFLKGYNRGYQKKGLLTHDLMTKSADFKRGYIEARKDWKASEPRAY